MTEIVFKDESYRIIGACFEIYKEKGSGFGEQVYQECLELEFVLQAIPGRPKVELLLQYKGRPLTAKFIPDFICFDCIIVELKSVSELCDEHRAQIHNYLKATGFKLGLLVNFGHYQSWNTSGSSSESSPVLSFVYFVSFVVPLLAASSPAPRRREASAWAI